MTAWDIVIASRIKNVLTACANVFQTNSIKKAGKQQNYKSANEICMTQSILLKYNEISFSLKFIRYIFKSSIWRILCTSLIVSLGIQPNCLLSLAEMKTPIAFLFPQSESMIISCKWTLMPFHKDTIFCNLDAPSLNLDSPVRDTLISTNEREIKLTRQGCSICNPTPLWMSGFLPVEYGQGYLFLPADKCFIFWAIGHIEIVPLKGVRKAYNWDLRPRKLRPLKTMILINAPLKSSLTNVNNQTSAFHTWITSVRKSFSGGIPRVTRVPSTFGICHFVIRKTGNKFSFPVEPGQEDQDKKGEVLVVIFFVDFWVKVVKSACTSQVFHEMTQKLVWCCCGQRC